MGLSLATALRLLPRAGARREGEGRLGISVAFVGAGGKTTSMFSLAHELSSPSLLTTTTHLGEWQLSQADSHIVARTQADLRALGASQVTVITGPRAAGRRLSSVSPEVLQRLRHASLTSGWPLLIEADGARQLPLKAPGANEPHMPSFVEVVVVVAGMSGLGRTLDGESVHRPDRYADISGLRLGERVTTDAIRRVLEDPRGGLAGIPARARRLVMLNQADTAEVQSQASALALALQDSYDAVIVASMRTNTVYAVCEPCAGIILAAGAATRFGTAKQLLPWRGEPLARVAVRAAIQAGLSPVVVVVGAHADKVAPVFRDLPVMLAVNENWRDGQASSIRAGLDRCPPSAGAAVFLLADQPLVTQEVVRALVAVHATESAPIIAPLVQEDRRGNPVLFDRETFAALRALRGNAGGSAIFPGHRVHYMPWHDDRIARDIDTPDDYRDLLASDRL